MSKRKKKGWPPSGADQPGNEFSVTAYAKNTGAKWVKCTDDDAQKQAFTALICVKADDSLSRIGASATGHPNTLLWCSFVGCRAADGTEMFVFPKFGCPEFHVKQHIAKYHTPEIKTMKVEALYVI